MRRLFALLTTTFLAGSLLAATADTAMAADPKAFGPNLVVVSGSSAKFYQEGEPTVSATVKKFEIKGNSSAAWPKKPYGFELTAPVSLYGMPADTEWRLLANYHDRSLVRNKVAFDLASKLDGLKWTPRSVFVELKYKGKYQGSYQLIETIKVAPNRVDIDGPGHQIVEFDKNGKFVFSDYGKMINSLVAPKSTANSAVTKAKIDKFLYWLKNNNSNYLSLMDYQSFVDYYLVREFTKDKDADFLFSNHWHTNSSSDSDPIVMGPVWDFDRSAGNEDSSSTVSSPKNWWVRGGGVHEPYNSRHLYNSLTKVESFRQALCDRWTQQREVFWRVNTVGVGNAWREVGKQAAANDTKLWGKGKQRPAKRASNYDGEVKYVQNWYRERFLWMDANIC